VQWLRVRNSAKSLGCCALVGGYRETGAVSADLEPHLPDLELYFCMEMPTQLSR
jgi:hypothetical protein